MSALARFSPSTALASASASRMRISRSASFDLGLALVAGRLLADLLLLVELGDADRLLARGFAGADSLQLHGVGHLTAFSRSASATRMSPIFSLSATSPRAFWIACGGGLLADGFDVARLVGDVGDVHVDQHQADLLQFRLERILDVAQERIAVAVDVLDPHRGDHLAQLAEDDVLGLLLDVGRSQSQQADRRVLHQLGRGADGHREHAGHVDADVLDRQRPRSGISICIGSRYSQS